MTAAVRGGGAASLPRAIDAFAGKTDRHLRPASQGAPCTSVVSDACVYDLLRQGGWQPGWMRISDARADEVRSGIRWNRGPRERAAGRMKT